MKTKLTALILSLAIAGSFVSCGDTAEDGVDTSADTTANEVDTSGDVSYDGKLEYDHSLELEYAKCFSVDYYKGGYKLIETTGGASILVVPEGMSVPEGLDENTHVLQQPIDNILVASTPVASLINAAGALDAISLTTYDADYWYIDSVKEAINDGRITYIGEYKEPDYELITASGSEFAVFSTMITDDVAAQLDELGVYVLLDESIDEDHPLARVEWIKLYGALFNREEQAKEVFDKQVSYIDEIAEKGETGKTVAIFYVTSKGMLYARNAGDYMAKMVELAGGEYILSDMGVGETGTTNMEMEAFYDGAKDSDYIIYIYSLGGKPTSLADVAERADIITEMKAYKEGNVWCTTPDFFQISDTIGSMINDIRLMMEADADTDTLTYLVRLK